MALDDLVFVLEAPCLKPGLVVKLLYPVLPVSEPLLKVVFENVSEALAWLKLPVGELCVLLDSEPFCEKPDELLSD